MRGHVTRASRKTNCSLQVLWKLRSTKNHSDEESASIGIDLSMYIYVDVGALLKADLYNHTSFSTRFLYTNGSELPSSHRGVPEVRSHSTQRRHVT